MNDFTNNVFDYLIEDGHPERKTALKELADSGYFNHGDRAALGSWLNVWEKNGTFCEDGILRARLWFGIEVPKKTKEVVIRVVIDYKLEVPGTSLIGRYDNEDGCTILDAVRAVRGMTTLDGAKVLDARWIDYTTKPDRPLTKQTIVRK